MSSPWSTPKKHFVWSRPTINISLLSAVLKMVADWYEAMSRAAASRQASEQGAREDVRETRTETTVLSIKTSDNKKWKMNDVEDIEERK